jgi:hypothetical protein
MSHGSRPNSATAHAGTLSASRVGTKMLPIVIKILSHQDWHRHQVWDDFWQVIYRVLTPM